MDNDDFLANLSIKINSIQTGHLFDNLNNIANNVKPIVHNKQNLILYKELPNSGSVSVNVSVWALCERNYYGNNCEIKCIPKHNVEHYGCDYYTGKKMCMDGWKGEDCIEPLLCNILVPCGPMEICQHLQDSYKCICKHNFNVKDNCEKPINPCLTSETHLCQNNGICYHSDALEYGKDTLHCACYPGYNGDRCQTDIDECSLCSSVDYLTNITNEMKLSASNTANLTCCSRNSECINEIGNYRCVCKNGWSGKYCQISPTIWPPNYNISLDNIILPIFKILNETNPFIKYIVNQSANIIIKNPTSFEIKWFHIVFSTLLIILIIGLIFVISCFFVYKKKWNENYNESLHRVFRNNSVSTYESTQKALNSTTVNHSDSKYAHTMPINKHKFSILDDPPIELTSYVPIMRSVMSRPIHPYTQSIISHESMDVYDSLESTNYDDLRLGKNETNFEPVENQIYFDSNRYSTFKLSK